MPQEGESFAGALDSLEARCRLETRALYESEGKEELLGESGVPESLRVWLEESRERALNEGGYRQGARTRLRGQVGGANNSYCRVLLLYCMPVLAVLGHIGMQMQGERIACMRRASEATQKREERAVIGKKRGRSEACIVRTWREEHLKLKRRNVKHHVFLVRVCVSRRRGF